MHCRAVVITFHCLSTVEPPVSRQSQLSQPAAYPELYKCVSTVRMVCRQLNIGDCRDTVDARVPTTALVLSPSDENQNGARGQNLDYLWTFLSLRGSDNISWSFRFGYSHGRCPNGLDRWMCRLLGHVQPIHTICGIPYIFTIHNIKISSNVFIYRSLIPLIISSHFCLRLNQYLSGRWPIDRASSGNPSTRADDKETIKKFEGPKHTLIISTVSLWS